MNSFLFGLLLGSVTTQDVIVSETVSTDDYYQVIEVCDKYHLAETDLDKRRIAWIAMEQPGFMSENQKELLVKCLTRDRAVRKLARLITWRSAVRIRLPLPNLGTENDKVNIQEINGWIALLRQLLKENPDPLKKKQMEQDLEGYLTCKRLIDEAKDD